MKDWTQELLRIPRALQEPESSPVADVEQDPLGVAARGQSGALPPGRDGEQAAADAGTRGKGQSLPFLDLIQEAFGRFDVTNIESFVGPAATMACQALQANAFANTGKVAFDGAPDLATAAHEAVHALLQKAGIGPADGRGRRADAFEAQAHRVAQAVVEGGNAEALIESILGADALDQMGDAWRGVQLDGDDANERSAAHPAALPEGGTSIRRPGIVAHDGSTQLRLRSEPSTNGTDNVVAELPFNTHLEVVSEFPGDWYFVTTERGEMGYTAKAYVNTNLPEPTANLHRVESGVPGTAIAIAERYYQSQANDWGQDLRFYVNVLAYVNNIEVPDSTDGWRQVHFQAGHLIWIPSVEFARGLQGVVNSGSWSYNAADAVGVAGAIERTGQFFEDLETAAGLSGQYLSEALARHTLDSLMRAIEALLLLLVGAAIILLVSTAIGALIGAFAGAGAGAAPGAAAGFEVGLAIIEWLGLAFLVVFVADIAMRLGGAFGTFLSTTWNANGDPTQLDQAGRELAEALGTLLGVVIEVLVLLAAARGIGWVMGRVSGGQFGEAAGDAPLRSWLGERITNVQQGNGRLPTPRDAYNRARGRGRGEGEGQGRGETEGRGEGEGQGRGRTEETPFSEEAIRPSRDGAEVAQGARQMVVGRHLASEQEGLAFIQRLAAGERAALTELGVNNVPRDFNPTSTEWGLGRTPDGRFVIIRGRSGYVNWADFPGVEARAHSHPFRPFEGEAGANGEGFAIEALVRGQAEAGGMANQVQFMPSAGDLAFMARNGVRGHIVQTPYAEVAPGRVGHPGQGQGTISIEIVQSAQAGRMGELPVYEAELIIRNPQGETMWQGRVQGVQHPHIGDMISTEPLVTDTGNVRAPEGEPGNRGSTQTRSGNIVRDAIDSNTTPEEALAALRGVLSEAGQRGLDRFARPNEDAQSVLARLLRIEEGGGNVTRILESRGAAPEPETPAAANARVQAEAQRLINDGILDQPAMRTALEARQPQAEVRGIIAEAMAEGAARGRVSGTPEASVLTNMKVAREVPGYRSVQEWAADHPGQNPARYFEHDGKLWDSVGEADIMTVRQTENGRLRIQELEEVKSGRNDTPGSAQGQLDGLVQALQAVGRGEQGMRIFEMEGKHTVLRDMTSFFDLAGVEGVGTRTTGPSGGRAWDNQLQWTTDQLNAMADVLIGRFRGAGSE